MIKRMLYFGKPIYLSTENQQLVILNKDTNKSISQPIEDMGFMVLDHPQISISFGAIERLASNNVVLIYCDSKHMPNAILNPISANGLQQRRIANQLKASEPLKKQLWKQTIEAKILNQALLLEKRNKNASPLYRLSKEVLSNDSTNREAIASKYYWGMLFQDHFPNFIRDRYGFLPNNLLNYGYAILRAAMARSLVGAGLFPSFGIFHHNQYNPFCLADDIMEPYRPFVDEIVLILLDSVEDLSVLENLTPTQKGALLQIVHVDTQFKNNLSPLMIALDKSSSSLVKSYEGTLKKLNYPTILKNDQI